MSKTTKKEIEFLRESNAIEREYSAEALEDAVQAWKYLKKFNYLRTGTILRTHLLLMHRLDPQIAGRIRGCDVWVGEHKQMKVSMIPDALSEWRKLLYDSEEDIKEMHVKFERIHPFEDGNGRTGRMLMNYQRLKLKLPILIIREGTEQFEYYKWFAKKSDSE